MSHEPKHVPFESIRSADFDRNLQLTREGILTDATALRMVLRGDLRLEDLSPSLQAVILSSSSTSAENELHFTGDGITTSFNLGVSPVLNSDLVFLNGIKQVPGLHYSITGTVIDFVVTNTPQVGDEITVHFKSLTGAALIQLGGFVIPFRQIIQTLPTLDPIVQELFFYGTNKISALKRVSKFDGIGLTQIGVSVNVDSGSPDATAMVETTNGGSVFIWAVGAAAGTHTITKIDTSSMTGVLISMNDPATVVTGLATDGLHIYVFMKGGATLQANSVQKLNAITNLPEAIIGPGLPGITTTGSVDLAVNLAGSLYVAYSNVNGSGSGEVRKFNVNTGFLTKRFTNTDFGIVGSIQPTRIIPFLDSLLVMDPLNQKIFKISATDVVTVFATTSFIPTDIAFDNMDVWISSGDTLYKFNQGGTTLNSLVPQATHVIQDIAPALGFIWTSYTDDVGIADDNITKIFPGLPGA